MATRAHVTRTTGTAAATVALLVLTTGLSACGTDNAGSGGGGSSSRQPGSSAGQSGGSTAEPPDSTSPSRPGSSGTSHRPTTPARPGTGTVTKGRVSVYFLSGEKLAPAHRQVTGTARATAAIKNLLTGPRTYEKKAGWSTAIPSGTKLNGVTINRRIATVDLSGRYESGGGSFSMGARLAQVVFTATQFSTVDKVKFELDGKPVTVFGGEGIMLNRPVGRADFEEFSPAVLVESPAIGDTVRSPVRIWGSANVFEAVFRLRIVDAAGRRAADVRVQATSGTGTRGTFDVMVPYRATRSGTGKLIAYYNSPKDGSEVVVARIPLTVTR